MYHFLRSNIKAFVILAAAVVFIIIGVYRGEVNTVMSKAIAICLECIGIG